MLTFATVYRAAASFTLGFEWQMQLVRASFADHSTEEFDHMWAVVECAEHGHFALYFPVRTRLEHLNLFEMKDHMVKAIGT